MINNMFVHNQLYSLITNCKLAVRCWTPYRQHVPYRVSRVPILIAPDCSILYTHHIAAGASPQHYKMFTIPPALKSPSIRQPPYSKDVQKQKKKRHQLHPKAYPNLIH
ncbi:hypothetical protein QTP88_022858 [Uroleucon formosanum]